MKLILFYEKFHDFCWEIFLIDTQVIYRFKHFNQKCSGINLFWSRINRKYEWSSIWCTITSIIKNSCLKGPDIGLAVRVFANGPGDLGSKTQKMVLDASLLNTQYYKVCIKGKVEQSRERSSALPYTLV